MNWSNKQSEIGKLCEQTRLDEVINSYVTVFLCLFEIEMLNQYAYFSCIRNQVGFILVCFI